MAEKKITRKIISPSKKDRPVDGKAPLERSVSKEVEVPKEEVVSSPRGEATSKAGEVGRAKKVCFFCQNKTKPTYTDIVVLRRYLTDRAKITARAKSSVCSRHQRDVAKQIKYARHLALLPFVPKV